jgi:hypothetical protein
MAKYVALTGINYPSGSEEVRVEVDGDVPENIVVASPWLLDQGHVKKVEDTAPAPKSKGAQPAQDEAPVSEAVPTAVEASTSAEGEVKD